MKRVEGFPDLAFDEKTSLVASSNASAHEAFMTLHRKKSAEAERLNILEEKISSQEKKIDMILDFLQRNINGSN